ncbi:Uu.00g023640.m01.CDS01 [Anthostomella pinea]|uniref:Uu.00g023640.m01.CDS01 n=1 Tax=Anthostomella pinea TaxID=933095 RepID=A0AAI8W0L7_9PEZI|nr:Uu.00g023640.m01.CDS01 [Anthostomella pinea]
MATLQNHHFVNGQWVSEEIPVHDLAKPSVRPQPRLERQPAPKPPVCGVLTKTIIESPIIRWALPVQLRSSRHIDVALVGDHGVQICELGRYRQLHEVAWKNDFGSRIRNALVMGNPLYPFGLQKGTEDSTQPTQENSDTEMMNSGNPISEFKSEETQFQQLLVLVLESGQVVFLFMQPTSAGSWEFVSTIHTIKGQRLVNPGYHMAIDPSSRYLTLACSENLFIMYQLEQVKTLRLQHSREQPLQPIMTTQARAVKGIIHKIEFLHPLPHNDGQVILLIIMIQAEVSKLAIYEWGSTESLSDVFAAEKSGHRLDDTFRLPSLIVPLTVSSTFLIISEQSMAICSDVLAGPPNFIHFELDSTQHHSTPPAVWTAWTRGIRIAAYHAEYKDVIYLAREDGAVKYLEIEGESGGEPDIVTDTAMTLQCNIDTAFASLFDPESDVVSEGKSGGDVIVTGGDSGSGVLSIALPRETLQPIGTIPNWSPTVDFVVTPGPFTGANEELTRSRGSTSSTRKVTRPDRVFACSGRGTSGAIIELRYGIEAKIGLDLTYISPIKQCWALPTCYDDTLDDGFFMLLGLPDSSAILHVSQDLSDVSERAQSAVKLDLSSATLAAYEGDGIVVQITTARHVTSDIVADPAAVVVNAAVGNGIFSLAVYRESSFKIMVYNYDSTSVSLPQEFEVEGEVTCLSVEDMAGKLFVFAGLWQGESPVMTICPTTSSQHILASPISFNLQEVTADDSLNEIVISEHETLGAITGIVSSSEHLGQTAVFVSTRNGNVLTLRLDPTRLEKGGDVESDRTIFGTSPSHVYMGTGLDDSPSILICNDAGLAILTGFATCHQQDYDKEIHRVWPTNAVEPGMLSPSVNSVARMHRIPGYGNSTLAIIAGPRILVTELQSRAKPLPRSIPVEGTPMKIVYSPRLEKLITIVMKEGLPSLHFFDPETGADISKPAIESKPDPPDSDYIVGLGNEDSKVVSLTEWRFTHNAKLYEFIVVSINIGQKQGCILLVSTRSDKVETEAGTSTRIRFWTKQKIKTKDALKATTTDDHGIFICAGSHLEYHTIQDKVIKVKVTRKHELPSPATWMQVVDGRLHVLTAKHSLIVLDYTTNLESDQMLHLHTDDICRIGLHSIKADHRITMVSDPMCGVYGMWLPPQADMSLKVVCCAELPASVRRFARGDTRPPWAFSRSGAPWFGSMHSGQDGSEILGLSIDGSLQYFSLLSEDVWRLLKYIQNLAMSSREFCPFVSVHEALTTFDPEPKLEPKSCMHVNGDILQICLDRHALEALFTAEPEHFERFRELLQTAAGDIDTIPFKGSAEGLYYRLAYQVLRDYLSAGL